MLVSRFSSNTFSILASHTTRHCHSIDNPLAKGFALDSGSVTFTVPQVKPKTNYIVVRAYSQFFLLSFLVT